MTQVQIERPTGSKALMLGLLLAALLLTARPTQTSTTFTVNDMDDSADGRVSHTRSRP